MGRAERECLMGDDAVKFLSEQWFCGPDDEPCDAVEHPVEIRDDPVQHPSHYTQHPSGIECIQITEHMSFCIGNAIKYLYRAGKKDGNEKYVQDLRKSVWYINREIQRFEERKTTFEWV